MIEGLRSAMPVTERERIEYIAGVIEDTAAALNGDVILDDDDKKWSADYLLKGAALLRELALTK